MAARPCQITVEEFRLFHKIDRALYSVLVIELQRDPLQSMQTMAFWIWLERTGFSDIIRKILSLPQFLINELAEEAVTCLKCIEEKLCLLSSDATEIPLTQSLMVKELSPVFFHEKRDSATTGIKKIVTEVCLKAMADIMDRALKRSSEQTLLGSKMLMSSSPAESSLRGRITQLGLGGDVSPMRSKGNLDVPREDRTMFVTFSKGYPVSEWEVREFFTRLFGDCIECVHMQEVKPPEQALYARIVFLTPGIIDFILTGVPKAKFTINGKHVWMRKFVPKNGSSSSVPCMLPNLPETI